MECHKNLNKKKERIYNREKERDSFIVKRTPNGES